MELTYFDAHCHVNFAAYDADREDVIRRVREAGVGMNVVGTQKDTSASAVELAEKHEGVWATIGLHPIHTSKSHHDAQELGEGGKEFTSRGEVFDAAFYERLAVSPHVIAIGECGLDYYRVDKESKKVQEEAFVGQIELANRVGKSLMLHVRASKGSDDAYLDALSILKAHAKVLGNFHFFAGSWETARACLDAGFTLSFTGVLTFTHDYDDVVKNAPLDMLISETDAPYVAPVPFRGRRNEPVYVTEVVRAIARIRGITEEEAAGALLTNVRRLFKIA